MDATRIFNNFNFSSVPFIGLANAKRKVLLTHPYLQYSPKDIHEGKTPWNDNNATLVGLSKNDITFALLSIDGKAEYVNRPKITPYNVSLRQSAGIEFDVDITPISDWLLPKEYSVEAFPQIFSAVPLDITYNITIDKLVTDIPNKGEGTLMMQGSSNRMMNGQISIPAGEIVDIGPVLKMIRRKKGPEFPQDNHLITRHVHLGIRKRLYG